MCHFVHGVGAQHQPIGPGTLQRTGGIGQQLACSVPLAGGLQVLHFGKVHAVQNDLGRMQAAELGLDRLVDLAVIGHSGFPAHAADEAQCFH